MYEKTKPERVLEEWVFKYCVMEKEAIK